MSPFKTLTLDLADPFACKVQGDLDLTWFTRHRVAATPTTVAYLIGETQRIGFSESHITIESTGAFTGQLIYTTI